MDIREINIDHIDAIKKLMLDIFSKEPWNDTWTDDQLHLYVSELIENKISLSFGLFEDDNMIGMALGHVKHWYEGTEYWIDEFGILPEKQHCGVGIEFLTEIERALIDKGVIYIVLITERTVPAYDFYKRNGFEEKEKTCFFVKRVY